MQKCEGAQSVQKWHGGHTFWRCIFWVTVSKAWNANVQLNIKALAEKELDSEHFVMIWLSDWKQEWVEHGTLACGFKEYIFGCL